MDFGEHSMADAQIDEFLAKPWIGALSILRGDGSPQSLPIWYLWNGEAFKIFSDAKFGWVKRCQADPRVAFTVFEHERPYRAVYSRGIAEFQIGASDLVRADIRSIVARYRAVEEVENVTDSMDGAENNVVLTIVPSWIHFQQND
jgi:nitroimidazol reductase NimA-like FMN-containing flavoprotein (pyridoxamine 5'-phosphate oxidase superfamily)